MTRTYVSYIKVGCYQFVMWLNAASDLVVRPFHSLWNKSRQTKAWVSGGLTASLMVGNGPRGMVNPDMFRYSAESMTELLGPHWGFNPSIGSCLVHELIGSAEENEGIGESVMKV